MRELLRPMLLVALVLLVPILPFLGFGGQLQAEIERRLDPPPPPAAIAGLTVGLLATDIVLPIPSSLVSTAAGAELGAIIGTLASWVGMTLGAVLGFYLAKRWGRGIATRFSTDADLARMDHLAERYGAAVVVITRGLPVLAEAAVLWMGCTQLAWRRFLPAVVLSNLGIAAVYSALGQTALQYGELPLALAGSIALPLLAATIARRFLR